MKILNFGSLNIDLVYKVEHFVRGGETIASLDFKRYPGGKGLNQSVALGKSGANVYHAGKIGTDGLFLLEILKDAGVDTSFVLQNGSVTGNALIQVDQTGQNCIIIYGGANKELTETEIDSVLARFDKGDYLLLQNEINCLNYLIDKAFEKGIKIALNPSPIDRNLLSIVIDKISYLLLNEIEGNELSNKSNPEEILQELHKHYPNCTTVLTLGKHGVVCFDGSEYHKNGIYDTPIVDTTAAGDTFTGYFISKISKGYDIKTALQIASKASSIAVSRAGAATSIPALDEVMRLSLPELFI